MSVAPSSTHDIASGAVAAPPRAPGESLAYLVTAIIFAGTVAATLYFARSMGGGMPIAAVTGRAEIMDAPAVGGLGGTYCGHPLSCAAALAAIETIEKEGLRCESLAVSGLPAHRGSLLDMSGARVPFPEGDAYHRCYVGFVDPEIEAPWGHPAHWVFVPAEGNGEAVLRHTNLPEHGKGLVRLFSVPLR